MEPIKVKAVKMRNWAGSPYVMFSTEKHGAIAELDYPIEGRKEVRVYLLKDNEADKTTTNYITLSSLPQGIIACEVACKAFLYGEGNHYVEKFEYPAELEEIRKQAFKENK